MGSSNLLSNGENGLHNNVHNHHSLGAEVEWENLKGVCNQKTGEANVVKDTEDPHKGNLSIARAPVGVDHAALGLSLSWRSRNPRVLINGTDDCPKDEGADHARDGSQEEWSTADFVDEESRTDSERQIQDSLACRELHTSQVSYQIGLERDRVTTYTELLVLVLDSGALVDDVHVVGEQGIARVLRNDTQRDDNGQPPPVAPRLEEIQIARDILGIPIGLNGLLDLAILKLDRRIIHIASSMMFS